MYYLVIFYGNSLTNAVVSWAKEAVSTVGAARSLAEISNDSFAVLINLATYFNIIWQLDTSILATELKCIPGIWNTESSSVGVLFNSTTTLELGFLLLFLVHKPTR